MTPDEMSGLLAAGNGEELRRLAALVPDDEAIVEVGSYRGQSTAFLASGSTGAKVFAVDPWDLDGNVSGRFGFAEKSTRNLFEYQLRAARLWSRVTPVQGFSIDVAADWKGPQVGLLFIDGDHSENAVRADVAAWTPHLADGATVAFDDYNTPRNPGVKAVVDALGWPTVFAGTSLAVCRW